MTNKALESVNQLNNLAYGIRIKDLTLGWDPLEGDSLKSVRENMNAYSFKMSIDGIDFNRIHDDLSYKNPMCLVSAGSHHYVVIHDSIIKKSKCLKGKKSLIDSSRMKKQSKCVIYIKLNEVEHYRHAVRDIKSSQWAGKAKKITVKYINV